MTLQPADLDRLEQFAREAVELRWVMTDWWYPPSALLDVDARLIAALSPAVVSELVAAARLGAAGLDVDRLRRAVHSHAVHHVDALPCNEVCAPDIAGRYGVIR